MPDGSATLPFVIPRGCGFIDFSHEVVEFSTKLSSRPGRSAVESLPWAKSKGTCCFFCPSDLTAS